MRILRNLTRLTDEEDSAPVCEILIGVDDVAGDGGGEETHRVPKPVCYAQQGPSKVRRHVNVRAHES